MCYYNGQKVAKAGHIQLLELEKQLAENEQLHKALIAGFDYGRSAVIRPSADKKDIDVVQMEWGFIPSYIRDRNALVKMRMGYKDDKGQFRPPMITLNSISEEMLAPNKIYCDAALHRRCLVISSGFFEWQHVYPLNKRTGQPLKTPNKIPHHIRLKDREYFFMAGIWQPWTDKETGEYVESYSIITTKANALMEQIHNSKKRMPTILTDELAYEWIFGNLDEKRISAIGQYQVEPSLMESWTIAKDFRETLNPCDAFAYEELEGIK